RNLSLWRYFPRRTPSTSVTATFTFSVSARRSSSRTCSGLRPSMAMALSLLFRLSVTAGGRMPYCEEMPEPLRQALYALVYYFGIVVLVRLAGKRLAGQTTTFDLVVLIQMAVVLQSVALRDGPLNAGVFLVTALAAHRG